MLNKFWKHHYGIIGKTNEIIVAAEALGLDDSDVLHAWSEGNFSEDGAILNFGNASDRLYLNVTPTTVDRSETEVQTGFS